MADHASAGPDAGAPPTDLIDFDAAVELSRELLPPDGKSYNTIARYVREGKLTKHANGVGDVRLSRAELVELLTPKAAT